jgi:hypothetical protein
MLQFEVLGLWVGLFILYIARILSTWLICLIHRLKTYEFWLSFSISYFLLNLALLMDIDEIFSFSRGFLHSLRVFKLFNNLLESLKHISVLLNNCVFVGTGVQSSYFIFCFNSISHYFWLDHLWHMRWWNTIMVRRVLNYVPVHSLRIRIIFLKPILYIPLHFSIIVTPWHFVCSSVISPFFIIVNVQLLSSY